MTKKTESKIIIEGAKTNNLKSISTEIPHNQLTVVTGVSGSGKSSLVFDVIAKEGQRRYFETLPSFSRQFLGKLNRPNVERIEGLSPVISIGQQISGINTRSTVGTLSDIYDWLRLLFARIGKSDQELKLSRALFSFNSSVGKCEVCSGIGKQEKIDLTKLVAHPNRSIREGALAPTLPNGYIMYSQVTIDVLNQVCEAEGFNVDIPWNDLTERQQHVILYGSNKIKVPFGKHSLESRLKWTGIKAKPREDGYYKGMIPIMSDILRRDRNANILKYVHSVTCAECNGTRLNKKALSVTVKDKSIVELTQLELHQLNQWFKKEDFGPIGLEIKQKICFQIELLIDLGLGHLTLERSSKTLSPSEIQRIRLANQLGSPLCDVLYVFDEPSIGLHCDENHRLVSHLKGLVNKGNTVIVVEHNLDTISNADHILEIGPSAGGFGGEVLFNGSIDDFLSNKELDGVSPTWMALNYNLSKSIKKSVFQKSILLKECSERNLKNIDAEFKIGALNIVSGKSGAGKSSLVIETLLPMVHHLLNEGVYPGNNDGWENLDSFDKLIFIDHAPIGRTPRSNPATYLGISDFIRDLYAKLPESKEKGFTKSRFSFNNKGGRCETCQGAGKIQLGMHFLGNVDLVCGTCNGDRFNEATLQIKYKGLSIADVYRLSVNDALKFFVDDKKVLAGLRILQDIGLGYLTLGQSSTTLSGGESQRIKIANHLQKKDSGNTLFVIMNPSIGLHQSNILYLMNLFDVIKKKGNTIVCIEQNETIIEHSDWHIELGPESGVKGGSIVHQGVPIHKPKRKTVLAKSSFKRQNEISLNGITTNGLKNIDVKIPKNQLTVVTGLSGSGKSSLVYDTLYAESKSRFTESLSTFSRSFLKENNEAKIRSFSGLSAAIGINRKKGSSSKRSTVGTLSGVNDALRLLYSRIAQNDGHDFTAQHFSFNTHLGACADCDGLGVQLTCNPEEVLVNTDRSILEGACSTNKAVAYYADPKGQFMATLKEVAKQQEWDINLPYNQQSKSVKETILYGTGETKWDITWEYANKTRSGTQVISAKWMGFCNYIDDEYLRKVNNKNIKHLEELLHEIPCETCGGSRLKKELLEIKYSGESIHSISQLSISELLNFMEEDNLKLGSFESAISKVVFPSIIGTLKTLESLGLGYLTLDRSINSLSGGERQRVSLAGQLTANLFGVTYVLDEPSIGLDNQQVILLCNLLRQIIAKGNTVVVVEHDPTFIKNADFLIEMGPMAGPMGGNIVYQGPLKGVDKVKKSVTYRMLKSQKGVGSSTNVGNGLKFGIKRASANNLKNIDVQFVGQQIIAVTGVSGSGKSSLIKDVFYQSWLRKKPVNCSTLFGMKQFDEVLFMTQESFVIGGLNTVASLSGVLDGLKAEYSKTKYANQLGLKRADFSYQSKNGKCKTCGGYGRSKTSMDFMSDIWLTCDTCNGLRYNERILKCKYEGYSIGDILTKTVDEIIDVFESKSLTNNLGKLQELGLGHLMLGQSLNALSGGESQRLKLANCLLKKKMGKTLYLLDEPSIGLHYFDIQQMIEVFRSIVQSGDTVLFIEHNKSLINAADQIVRLGPGSGEEGGALI